MTRIGAGWNSDNRHKHFLSQTPKTRSIQHEHAPSPSPRFSELRPCRCRKTFSTAQTSARIWIQFRTSTGSAANCIRRPWPSWHSSKLQGTIHWLHKIDETMCIKFRAWPKLAKIVRKIASLLAASSNSRIIRRAFSKAVIGPGREFWPLLSLLDAGTSFYCERSCAFNAPEFNNLEIFRRRPLQLT